MASGRAQFFPAYNVVKSWLAVWDQLMDGLAAAHDAAVQMIDTSIVRVHQHGACIANNGGQHGSERLPAKTVIVAKVGVLGLHDLPPQSVPAEAALSTQPGRGFLPGIALRGHLVAEIIELRHIDRVEGLGAGIDEIARDVGEVVVDAVALTEEI